MNNCKYCVIVNFALSDTAFDKMCKSHVKLFEKNIC